jgi:hypothetical protein
LRYDYAKEIYYRGFFQGRIDLMENFFPGGNNMIVKGVVVAGLVWHSIQADHTRPEESGEQCRVVYGNEARTPILRMTTTSQPTTGEWGITLATRLSATKAPG